MRRATIVLAIAALLTTVVAMPAYAANDNYHFVQHRMGAAFNNAEGRGTVQVYAAWYSPQSDFGGGVGPAVPSVYVTFWGDKVGLDCTISQSFYDFDFRWSMNHAYVGVSTDCGYLELTLRGDRGRDKNDGVTPGAKYNEADFAELRLGGQSVPVVFQGGSISAASVAVKR